MLLPQSSFAVRFFLARWASCDRVQSYPDGFCITKLARFFRCRFVAWCCEVGLFLFSSFQNHRLARIRRWCFPIGSPFSGQFSCCRTDPEPAGNCHVALFCIGTRYGTHLLRCGNRLACLSDRDPNLRLNWLLVRCPSPRVKIGSRLRTKRKASIVSSIL